VVRRKVDSITDLVREHLSAMAGGGGDQVDNKLKADYKKRKLVEEVVEKVYLVRPGPGFTTQAIKKIINFLASKVYGNSQKTMSSHPPPLFFHLL
jgi:hypothetical protein